MQIQTQLGATGLKYVLVGSNGEVVQFGQSFKFHGEQYVPVGVAAFPAPYTQAQVSFKKIHGNQTTAVIATWNPASLSGNKAIIHIKTDPVQLVTHATWQQRLMTKR